MTTTIYVSDDGYWMTEAEARATAAGDPPAQVHVLRKLTATMVMEGHPLAMQPALRTFHPIGIEVDGDGFWDAEVSRECGRRVKHFEE